MTLLVQILVAGDAMPASMYQALLMSFQNKIETFRVVTSSLSFLCIKKDDSTLYVTINKHMSTNYYIANLIYCAPTRGLKLGG